MTSWNSLEFDLFLKYKKLQMFFFCFSLPWNTTLFSFMNALVYMSNWWIFIFQKYGKFWSILLKIVGSMKLLFLKSDFCIQMLFDVFIQDIELTTQHSQWIGNPLKKRIRSPSDPFLVISNNNGWLHIFYTKISIRKVELLYRFSYKCATLIFNSSSVKKSNT